MTAVNIFDIDLNEKKCVICSEYLNTAKTYKMPCCNREFHSHCIVTWFRHRPSNLESGKLGGNCPFCGDRGNNSSSLDLHSMWGYTDRRGIMSNMAFNEKKRFLYNYCKKHNGPKQLSQLIEKYEKALKNKNLAEQELKDYKAYIKNNETSYSETNKKLKILRNNLWNKSGILSKSGNTLLAFNVIPIIVPQCININ